MTTRRELANALRALSMDAVRRANSGNPGTVAIAQVLCSSTTREIIRTSASTGDNIVRKNVGNTMGSLKAPQAPSAKSDKRK
jgi:hypothetical protein